MINELHPNKIYYEGNGHFPFYTKESCTRINKDGTYDTEETKRKSVTSSALKYWCLTKEEAVQDMVDFYFKRFHNGDMSVKADVYQEFAKDMGIYTKINYPEYYL